MNDSSSQSPFSLVSRGSRQQLHIAVLLIAVIPLLSLAFILIASFLPDAYGPATRLIVAVMALVLSLTGYLILSRYPENILRLRHYLKEIAAGELPEQIDLIKAEDDISAIEAYLNVVLQEMRQRVRQLEAQLVLSRRMQETIRAQAEEILDAERHRVMIQSLAAACHHIGQPATVLRAYLDMLSHDKSQAINRERLTECLKAAESIAQVLDKLRQVSEYRTIPYTLIDSETLREEILDIEPHDAHDPTESPPSADAGRPGA